MKKRAEPKEAQWISWGWDTVPGQDFFISHVGQMSPDNPPNPKTNLKMGLWHLDYSFTPGRIKIGTQPWEDRMPRVGYLIPRYKPWYEGPARGASKWPNKCTLTFAVRFDLNFDQIYWQQIPCGYARFLDPDGVLANAMTQIATTARALNHNGYWTVHHMAVDLLQSMMALKPVEPGVYEIRADTLSTPVDPVVSRATAYLQEHLAEPVEVRDVARHVRLAESTLCHHFKKAGVGSPMKVLQRLRVLLAKAFLAKGWKLETIAQAVGLYDGLYLSRVFKQVEGVSPSEFLKRQKPATSKP